MQNITLIGCGWFGLPLAKSLINQGLDVITNKRSVDDIPAIEAQGIKCVQLDLAEDSFVENIADLFNSDGIVINLPPGLRRGERQYLSHLQKLKTLIGQRQYQKVIFISTTGVYPSLDKTMDENDAAAHSEVSDILLQAEALFRTYSNSCVVRFSGLVGPKRHPGRFFAGKKDVDGANVVVNLVHLDDCVAAVSAILLAEKCADIYNLAASEHPTREAFYTKATAHLGFDAPTFSTVTQPSKVINGEAICTDLGFRYLYSDPFKMLDAC